MTWLHTCLGLGFGWLLYVMFLTGSVAVFNDEISAWMTPEIGCAVDGESGISLAEARLQTVAVGAETWTITPSSPRQRFVRIEWAGSQGRGSELLDPGSGQLVMPRETQGGLFFHRLHYRFQTYGCCRGFWVSGAAAIALIVSLISGLIIHRRLIADFFTLRLRAGARVALLDLHKRIGLLALPFHFMIALTGLMPMVSVLMFAPVIAGYRGDAGILDAYQNYDSVLSAFLNERRVPSIAPREPGSPATLVPLGPVVAAAKAHWGGDMPGRIAVSHVGHVGALIDVTRSASDQVSTAAERIVFDGTSGRLIQSFQEERPVLLIFSTLYGLHTARFASVLTRWGYFLLGLASTALIGTGLMFWTIKRRPATQAAGFAPLSHRLVEQANAAVMVSLPIAIAGFFWSNRILPVDVVGRADREVQTFLAVWVASFVMLMAMRPIRAWIAGLSVAAVAFAGVPVVNVVTTNRGLWQSLVRGDWVMMSFDLTMLGVAGLCGVAAWRTCRLFNPD